MQVKQGSEANVNEYAKMNNSEIDESETYIIWGHGNGDAFCKILLLLLTCHLEAPRGIADVIAATYSLIALIHSPVGSLQLQS